MSKEPKAKIEKNIPMPARRGLGSQFPFKEMQIGDSFFTERAQTKIASLAAITGLRHGMKFSTRREGKGTRVWRIA